MVTTAAAVQNRPDSALALASQERRENEPIFFISEDWTAFRTIDGVCRRAGVSPSLLRRLVLKELVDNALDATEGTDARVSYDVLPDGRFLVEDNGPGILGEPPQIADLFSIRRPLTSSKLLRMPTRGALGNGLRVVAGAVIASGGTIDVWTHNRHLSLTPQDTGDTHVAWEPADYPSGTRITVRLGAAIPNDLEDCRVWATEALLLQQAEPAYTGQPSAYWFDADSFFELLQAAGAQPVRAVMARLDGCTGAKTSRIAGRFLRRSANTLDRGEAEALLNAARAETKPIRPGRFGTIGRMVAMPGSYAKQHGILTIAASRGRTAAELPVVVEAWAERMETDTITVLVNRTPVTGTIYTARQPERADLGIFGCNLHHRVTVGRAPIGLYVNITTPYMPITSDGKAPDLARFLPMITETIAQAARRTKKTPATGSTVRPSDKAWILDYLDDAIARASGDGRLRYSQRQLYYAIRDLIKQAGGPEPTWDNFCGVLTEYEATTEDLQARGLYRDTRGLVYHPHSHQTIPPGTIAVEQYERPDWLFNKILYCEKEGFFPVLIDDGWPERYDCALLTSKGFATRAARDLLDLLGETDEEITFYCIHDADAPGTRIYHALQEGTRARSARRVQVINLGLEPEEAEAMGLPVEAVTYKRRQAVGEYVSEDYEEWLQTHRVELNAMTSPAFLDWLNEKLAPHDQGKVRPPDDVLAAQLAADTEALVREQLAERILMDADLDGQVAAKMATLQSAIAVESGRLQTHVDTAYEEHPTIHWKHPVRQRAEQIASTAAQRQKREG